MSVQIHFQASWDTQSASMLIEMEFNGQRFVERMDRHDWRKYVYQLENEPHRPLKLGGQELEVSGKSGLCWETIDAIRDYLLRVDDALRITGSTDKLAAKRIPKGTA